MPNVPRYPDDTCPACNGKCISACRCADGQDRFCENKHVWHWENGQKLIGSHHHKQKMKTLDQLYKEFGARVCPLVGGSYGIRAGIHVTVRDPQDGDGYNAGDPVKDFIASDESVDRYNEKIMQDGWQLDNFMANPVVPDCHDYSSVGKILGKDILPKDKQIQMVTGRKALCTRILFAVKANPMAKVAYDLANGGFLNSQSVGFIPLEWTNGNANDQPDRTYSKCELLEKSLVVVPANPGATIGAALKSGAVQKSDLRELAQYLKHFCSEETPDPARQGSASAPGVHDAQTLQILSGLNDVLKGAR